MSDDVDGSQRRLGYLWFGKFVGYRKLITEFLQRSAGRYANETHRTQRGMFRTWGKHWRNLKRMWKIRYREWPHKRLRPAYRKTCLVDLSHFSVKCCNKIRNSKDDENRRSIRTVLTMTANRKCSTHEIIAAVDRVWRIQLAHNPQLKLRLVVICVFSQIRERKNSVSFFYVFDLRSSQHGNTVRVK